MAPKKAVPSRGASPARASSPARVSSSARAAAGPPQASPPARASSPAAQQRARTSVAKAPARALAAALAQAPPLAKASSPAAEQRVNSTADKVSASAVALSSAPDRRVAISAAKERILFQFQSLDTNKDGIIELKELAEVLQELDSRTWTQERLDNLMSVINTNGDGKINFPEFLEWVIADSLTDEHEALFTSLASQEVPQCSGEYEFWRVVHSEVAVRDRPDLKASKIGVKKQGMFVLGLQEGDWLALLSEPGFMRIQQKSGNLLQKHVQVKPQRPPAGVEETFESYTWLNDASISFASNCLVSSGSQCIGPPRAFSKSIVFMDPAMAFWLTMQDDPRELEEARKVMNFGEAEVLLCPINDTDNIESADVGMHWTLLVCWGGCPPCVPSRRPKARASAPRISAEQNSSGATDPTGPFLHFWYYDSFQPAPPSEATKRMDAGEDGITYDDDGFVQEVSAFVRVLKGIKAGDQIVKVGTEPYSKDALLRAEKSGVGYEITVRTVTSGSFDKGLQKAKELAQRLAGRPVEVGVGSCARQTNFYDCGVYVLLFSEIIAVTLLDARNTTAILPPPWEERLQAVTPEEISACRAHYRSLAISGRA